MLFNYNFGHYETDTDTGARPASGVNRAYVGNNSVETEYAPTVDDLNANGCIGSLEFTADEKGFIEFMPLTMTTSPPLPSHLNHIGEDTTAVAAQ